MHCPLSLNTQDYQKVWQGLADASGLASEAILDIRGNHDVFDVTRYHTHGNTCYLTRKLFAGKILVSPGPLVSTGEESTTCTCCILLEEQQRSAAEL